MTEDEYLGSLGLSSPVSDFLVDKMRGNRELRTQRGQDRFRTQADKASQEYEAKRNKAKEDYRKLIETGKIREKTAIERSLDKAKGHPDNPSVQAARRMLEKRGIDWKTGKKIKK